MGEPRRSTLANPYRLTDKEIEVLQCGLDFDGDYYQTAEELCISLTTVKTHIIRAREKMGVSRNSKGTGKGKSSTHFFKALREGIIEL